MTKDFKDYFSSQSGNYSAYRPQYPPELFSYLASISRAHDQVWDCATGTGQSAVMLAKHFKRVIATDASREQIDNASLHQNVDYRVASAEHSGIDHNSIDLIAVSQALHWFDIDAFASEANRVLRKNGVLAAWTYNLLSVHPSVDALVSDLYQTTLGPYWPKERLIVEREYRDIQFDFDVLKAPAFVMTARWDLSQLLGYLNTWSATRRYEGAKGVNPVAQISDQLACAWGDHALKRVVSWPLTIKIWRK